MLVFFIIGFVYCLAICDVRKYLENLKFKIMFGINWREIKRGKRNKEWVIEEEEEKVF